MAIEFIKMSDCLSVTSNIYFDEGSFCVKPFVHLLAYKDPPYYWNTNTIAIGICDYDDFHIGVIYQPKQEDFFPVLHELINWMVDHENGNSSYEKLVESFDFFPDCHCYKSGW